MQAQLCAFVAVAVTSISVSSALFQHSYSRLATIRSPPIGPSDCLQSLDSTSTRMHAAATPASDSAQNNTHAPTHKKTGAPWLRAAVMGINDGLVSTASLMLGVGAGAESLHAMQVCRRAA